MIKFKIIAISMVASTLFGAASCMAQTYTHSSSELPYTTFAPVPSPLHASRGTQIRRCQEFGRYVNLVASARDRGESEKHLITRLGLDGQEVGGLPENTLAAGGTALIQIIYAKNSSPADWQTAIVAHCEKKIVS